MMEFRHRLNCWLAPIHDKITKPIVSPLPSLVKLFHFRILEIGVGRGFGAKLIIDTIRNAGFQVEYYGFDLFEISEMDEIKAKLERMGVTVHLFKGDSRETLPEAIKILPKMDFVLIDGGHPYDIVKSDLGWVRELMHERTVVVLDDYKRIEAVTKVVDEIDRGIYDVKAVHARHIQPIPPSVCSYIQMAIVTEKSLGVGRG